jgi:hypothetical protein
MKFIPNVAKVAIPSRSGRWRESTLVAKIQPADVDNVRRIITETLVQHDCQGWSCQDYVLEALKRLNEEQIVDD